MGGEMAFYHYGKPIENISHYNKLIKAMKCDLKKTSIPIITDPISTWSKNEQIMRDLKCYNEKLGKDEDYILSIDMGRSTRNPNNHYYIMFPKDPNKFKVLSNLHARGLSSVKEYDSQEWIHPWLVRLAVNFPGVFKLYYGDGYSGYTEGNDFHSAHYGDHVISEMSGEIFYLNPSSYSYVDPINEDYLEFSDSD